MRLLNICVFLLLFAYKFVYGFKILGLFAHKGKSHFDTFEPLMKALAAKGHDVTVISHFPQKERFPNYTDVYINSGDKFVNVINLAHVSSSPRLQQYVIPLILAYAGVESCTQGLSNQNFTNFISDGSRFDVVITELFNTECFLSVLRRFEAPMIGISSCTIMAWDDFTVGVPSNPSYIPNSFMPFSDKMTFLERLENTFMHILTVSTFEFFIDIPGRIVASGYFTDTLPNLKAIAANISLLLVNNHFSITLPRPLPPNYIDVGGIHLGNLKKPPLVRFYYYHILFLF
ncbi:hypothetical protein RI129_007037 [Pyrocoelia pectoralis]|uniref:Glucuronosyltransferase n=1 Tax=Pyrocoelia pectoralis TaxID=417401 RepID=A0AAN7ZI79_9COLE